MSDGGVDTRSPQPEVREAATPAAVPGSEALTPASSRRLPRVGSGRWHLLVPLGVSLALSAWLFAAALHRFRVPLAGYDLGYFAQASWLIENGLRPFVTVRGLHLIGDHSYWIMYPIAWIVSPFPTAEGLLLLQSLALGAAVFPLYALCRHLELRAMPTLGLLAAYALLPAMRNLNVADFHPEILLVPGVLTAVWAALTRHWALYAVAVAFLLLNREDTAISVAGLGLLLALTTSRRAGVLTALAAVLTLLVNRFVLMPYFSGAGYVHADQLPYGDGAASFVAFVLGNPVTVLGDLVTAQNATFVLALLGPLAFLSLLAPRWLAPAVPVQVLLLLSDRQAAHTIDYQYAAQAVPYVLVAAAFGLQGMQRSFRSWSLLPLLLTAGMSGFVSLSNDSPVKGSNIWQDTGPRGAALLRLADRVPADVPVSALPAMWPYLAEREELYSYPLAPDPAVSVLWVVIERGDPFVLTTPLPTDCTVLEEAELVVLATCPPQ